MKIHAKTRKKDFWNNDSGLLIAELLHIKKLDHQSLFELHAYRQWKRTVPAFCHFHGTVTIVYMVLLWNGPNHKVPRVVRVQQCPSPCRNFSNECYPQPPPWNNGGGNTRLGVRGWGSPNSFDWRKAQHSVYSVGQKDHISVPPLAWDPMFRNPLYRGVNFLNIWIWKNMAILLVTK